jgi:hypothetical protein
MTETDLSDSSSKTLRPPSACGGSLDKRTRNDGLGF